MTNGEIILKLIKDVTGIELELGEEFNIRCSLLKVTQKGLVNVDNGYECNVFLQEFIEDIKIIKVKPKFPKSGTRYYFVSRDGTIGSDFFEEFDLMDVINFKIGNYFSTYEAVENNKEKIMEIIKSPEKFNIKE